MTDYRSGDLLDVEFILNNGHSVVLRAMSIKVFDALRMMKPTMFDKHFVWGKKAGVAVEEIAGWRIIDQYED